jgi:hypothetical protein
MDILLLLAALVCGVPVLVLAALVTAWFVVFFFEGIVWMWAVILRIPFNSETFGPSR